MTSENEAANREMAYCHGRDRGHEYARENPNADYDEIEAVILSTINAAPVARPLGSVIRHTIAERAAARVVYVQRQNRD